MNTEELAVLDANDAFYRAFSKQDMKGIKELWSADHDIAVIHPGWPPLLGHKAVFSSWQQIMEGEMSPSISCVDARVNIFGETAVVICTEVLANVGLVATNIFVLEDGDWKMIHHHAGPLPTMDNSVEAGKLH